MDRLANITPRLFALFAAASCHAEEQAIPQREIDFFEKRIRPVLVERCYKCHSAEADKIKGALAVDSREGLLAGGDSGPAVIPKNVEGSLLIAALRYQDPDLAMPPEKEGGRLPDSVVRDFEEWVRMGAPDPRIGGHAQVQRTDREEARTWWAFQPPQRTELPSVRDPAWPRTDVDRFLLAELEEKNLKPAPDADKTTLLRRVHFDLVGLPPTLKEIDDFITDPSPDALERVVDKLLSSAQFGERWGRHWLDVARYAESSGKDVNVAYPHAWRYRDYVIAAFNSGKPYDEFLREQIAGDLLPSRNATERAEQLIATGFLAIGPKSHNEQNPRQFYLDVADEQIDSMSQAILGVTIACARCHDHKFDPIPQRDYYALAGIFLSTETRYGTARGIQNRHPARLVDLPAGTKLPVLDKHLSPRERATKQEQLERTREELRQIFTERAAEAWRGAAGQAQPARIQLRFLQLTSVAGALEAELASFDENGDPKPLAMGVTDLPKQRGTGVATRFASNDPFGARQRRGGRPEEFSSVSDARFRIRGEADRPGEPIPRGVPTALSPDPFPVVANETSGRRELANWLTSRNNPLTARVFVNRVWHWLFGRGLVASCDNFGTTGELPSNQALLDTLAVEFMESGWNVKALIRKLVLSRTYTMSSAFDPVAFEVDPENTLRWRANRRRLDAESTRDAMLFATGLLEGAAPVGTVIAESGEGLIGGNRRRAPAGIVLGIDEQTIVNANGPHRSVYLPTARDIVPDTLSAFDFVDSTLVNGSRERTNVPAQALYLLNGDFVGEQSARLAERVLKAYPDHNVDGSLEERLRYAYWLVFNRSPDEVEKRAARDFFRNYPGDSHSAWRGFSRALFCAAEFRYLN